VSRRSRLVVSGAVVGFFALLGLDSCGGSSLLPSYTITAAALSPSPVVAGGTSKSTVTVTPQNGFAGSVTLSCTTIGGGNSAPVCNFTTNPVIVTGPTAVESTLTASTSINTAGGAYTIAVKGSDITGLAPSNGPQSLTLTTAAVIQHVVVVFQENRTPDNLFQDPVLISRGADIAGSGLNSQGKMITLQPIDLGTTGSNPQNFDLSHSHSAFVAMYDGGKMDGADLIPCVPAPTCPPKEHPNPQFMYVIPSDVGPYFALAEQYTFGDRMFQTNQGPSFPAHQFILSGTSAPTSTSDLFAAENPTLSQFYAGCVAPAIQNVVMIDPTGSETASPPEYPCFDHPTLTDLLDAKGITWRYYEPTVGSIWSAPDAIEHICQEQTINGVRTCAGPGWVKNVILPEWHVLEDIANGQLAQVSWVIPDATFSDHAYLNQGSGPDWVASIVNGLGQSQYWANTAIIITWDDWGGWYDHVPPKVINDGVSWGSGYVHGFRVPLIVVSPYAKAGYISHTTHDFGSILKFIEMTLSLSSLGYADAYADDLSDCFNLTQSPISFKNIPTALDPSYFINSKSAPMGPDDE